MATFSQLHDTLTRVKQYQDDRENQLPRVLALEGNVLSCLSSGSENRGLLETYLDARDRASMPGSLAFIKGLEKQANDALGKINGRSYRLWGTVPTELWSVTSKPTKSRNEIEENYERMFNGGLTSEEFGQQGFSATVFEQLNPKVLYIFVGIPESY